MLAALFAACGEDKKDDTVSTPSTPLKVEQIIANPKAVSPEDTVVLTANITSSSQNEGDIPTTRWTADGGTFITDNQISVRWVAPATAGVYRVSVKATNSANTASAARDVFVGTLTTLVNGEAGQITLQANGTDFYYRRTPKVDDGVEVYAYAGGSSDAVNPVRPTGLELVYAADLSYEAHATRVPDSLTISSANPRPRHIYVGDFGTRTLQRISKELAAVDQPRRDEFAYPSISPDGAMIAFQGNIANAFSASLDSVDLFIYWRAGPARIRATFTHANHKNFFPTFSTDQKWLTFISDRSGVNRWEIYGMPVNGTTVTVDPASVVQLTSTGGTITSTLAGSRPALPMRAWSPVSPVLATVNGDGVLYWMSTSSGGATLSEVAGVPLSIQELSWSGSGSVLVVVATYKDSDSGASWQQIYTVAGGVAQLRYEAIPGDLVRDVALSPDNAWMVYRLTRSGQAWFELLDLDAGRYSDPIPLMAALPAGDAAAYRASMSLAPAWGLGDQLIAPAFTGLATPAVISIDVSGAVQ